MSTEIRQWAPIALFIFEGYAEDFERFVERVLAMPRAG
jgi:hypothetical protein